MITTETKEIVSYQCDNCENKYTQSFITFDVIDDIQMRILEHKPQTRNNHYTYGRKTVDFCCTDCALKYLSDSMTMFIKEITASKSNR